MKMWEEVLQLERLRLSAPDVVYATLERLAKPGPPIDGALPESAEDILRARNEPLIDLGLARFASAGEKILPLWNQGGAIRVALLSNRNAGPVFPRGYLKLLLFGGTSVELAALLGNPTIAPTLLASIIKNEAGLDENRWQEAVVGALSNERLRYTIRNNTPEEDLTRFEHEKPIYEVWRLFETVEPTETWARILSLASAVTFAVSPPESYAPDLLAEERRPVWKEATVDRWEMYERDLLRSIQKRWRPQAAYRMQPGCDPWEWSRYTFAKAFWKGRSYKLNEEFFRDHEDVAFRRVYYAYGTITPEWQLHKLKDLDGLSAGNAIVENRTLYEHHNSSVLETFYHLFRTNRRQFQNGIAVQEDA